MGQVHDCTKSALRVLNGEAGNTFWHIRALGVGGYHVSSWFELSSTRLVGPALNLLAAATFHAERRVVSKDDWQKGLFLYHGNLVYWATVYPSGRNKPCLIYLFGKGSSSQ